MRKIGLLLAISVCMGASLSAYAQEVGRYAIVPAKDGALISIRRRLSISVDQCAWGIRSLFPWPACPRPKLR